MSSTLLDDDEYPYSAKPPTVLKPREYTPRPQRQIAWGVVFGWALRLAFAGLVLLVIVMLPFVAIGYRAYRQAAAIAELHDRGCFIGYSNEIDPNSLRGVLCDIFGSECFDDVTFVSATELNRPESAASVCRLCGRFNKLEAFTIQSDQFRFDMIAKWPHLDNLDVLAITSSKITDEDLLRISRMSKLTHLEITGASFTGAGLQHLSRLPQLESLTIGSGKLDGSFPAIEAGFPNLKSLTIRNSPLMTDQTVINLGPLPELTKADFNETQLSDKAVEHVSTGGKLEDVYLSKTRVTDKCFENLAHCSQLSNVDVTDTDLTDAGVVKLQSCFELSFLNLSGTKVTGKGFDALRGQQLDVVVDRTELDDGGLSNILKIPGIWQVSANETKVSGTGAIIPKDLDSLYWLDLSDTKLSNMGLQTLSRAHVHDLVLTNTTLDNNGLMLFVGNDFISCLHVNETKVTAEGCLAFYEARKKRLEAANKKETLELDCDFPDAVEPYLPKGDDFSVDGTPLDVPSLEPEQAPAADPPQP